MLKLKKMAVTGGLASGKTSVCKVFQNLGAYVVSADEIVHQLLSPDNAIGQEVIKLIGTDIVVNSKIDRAKIAKKVFDEPQLLRALEKILHPKVEQEIEKRYQNVSHNPQYTLFIAEIPLLFEAGLEKNYDAVLTVLASDEICQNRFVQSRKTDKQEYLRRSSNQLSPEEKAKKSTYVIYNNGSPEELEKAVRTLYHSIQTT